MEHAAGLLCDRNYEGKGRRMDATRHFSMLRELPPRRFPDARQRGVRRRRRVLRDGVRRATGTIAYFYAAAALAPAAFIFDVFDGRVARSRHSTPRSGASSTRSPT